MYLHSLDIEAASQIILNKVRMMVGANVVIVHAGCGKIFSSNTNEAIKAKLLEVRFELGLVWEISWNDGLNESFLVMDLDCFSIWHPREDVSKTVLLDLREHVVEKKWKRCLWCWHAKRR